MQVNLKKNFPLEHTAQSAWQLLSNVDDVAACMPGAQIVDVVDDNNYKGTVKVKLGPVTMSFKGDIKVQSIDADKQQIHLIAEGTDNKGTSTANMDLTAQIEKGENTESALIGDALVTVSGKLANFGARMMSQVSDQILEQFADNFRNKLAAAAQENSSEAGDGNETSSESESQLEDVNPPAAENQINGFKFAWNALIGFIMSFFRRTK